MVWTVKWRKIRRPRCILVTNEDDLVGNQREDYLFGLQQEYERHLFYVSQIEKCDARIARFLEELIKTSPVAEPAAKPFKRANKNSIEGVDLNKIAYRYFQGVDIYDIPGVSHSTVLILMSEIGPEGLKKFPSNRPRLQRG